MPAQSIQSDELMRSNHSLSFFLLAVIVAPFLTPTSFAQQFPQPQSVADAARAARDLKNNTAHPHRVITNEYFAPRTAAPPPPDRRFLETISYAEEIPQAAPACDSNAAALRLKSEIQSSQSDLESLRQQSSIPTAVISDGDYDPQYFKPGGSGLNVGSAPLLDNQPPVPARVSAVQVEERIDNLQKLLLVACEPPEAAKLQIQLDSARRDVDLAARTLALDWTDFYRRVDFTSDAEGQRRITAEQQQVQDMQAEIDRLQSQLDAQIAREKNQSR